MAATGHRPDKLGGFSERTAVLLFGLAVVALQELAPTAVISGMALGFDQSVAEAALMLSIPLIAAVPFGGQERRWPAVAQCHYHALLAGATEVHIISPGAYSSAAMELRNRWMVDHCSHLIALWNGSSGGTRNCLRYAEQRHRTYTNLWPRWMIAVSAV